MKYTVKQIVITKGGKYMTLKYVTLEKWADYLKVYADCLGKYSVMLIGSACGEILGLRNPFVIRLKSMETSEETEIYLPSMEE